MTDPAGDGERQAVPSALRRMLPAPSVAGFAVLLAVLFALSYAAGSFAGPVAPGMRPVHGGEDTPRTGEHGGMDGMNGTHGLKAPSRQEAGR